jgi:hypothetical protein
MGGENGIKRRMTEVACLGPLTFFLKPAENAAAVRKVCLDYAAFALISVAAASR